MQLTARNKIFIASIVGAVVLILGFDLLMAGDMAPGMISSAGADAAFNGIALLGVSGFIGGICYAVLDRSAELKASAINAAASGAAAGLLIFLASCAMVVVNASSGGLASAAVELFTGAFDMAPLLVAALIVLAAFGALGGTAAKLAVMALVKK